MSLEQDELLRGGIFIGGPKACAIVFDKNHVEIVIEALCKVTGDNGTDYTATDLDNPQPIELEINVTN
jgi:hypothetical protein